MLLKLIAMVENGSTPVRKVFGPGSIPGFSFGTTTFICFSSLLSSLGNETCYRRRTGGGEGGSSPG